MATDEEFERLVRIVEKLADAFRAHLAVDTLDVSGAKEDAAWRKFREEHPELRGFYWAEDTFTFYDHSDFSDERLLEALRRAGRPEGITTLEVISACYPNDEWRGDQTLQELSPKIGSRLWSMSHKGQIQRVPPGGSGKPALWRAKVGADA